MKNLILCSLFTVFFNIDVSQGQCQNYIDSLILNIGNSRLLYNKKELPSKVKKAFTRDVIKSKIDFRNISDFGKINLKSKEEQLIFLFSILTENNEVIIGVYNTEGVSSYGFYYFFTLNDEGRVIEGCSFRKVEMICDWNRLKSIVDNKEYDRSIPPVSIPLVPLLQKEKKNDE